MCDLHLFVGDPIPSYLEQHPEWTSLFVCPGAPGPQPAALELSYPHLPKDSPCQPTTPPDFI